MLFVSFSVTFLTFVTHTQLLDKLEARPSRGFQNRLPISEEARHMKTKAVKNYILSGAIWVKKGSSLLQDKVYKCLGLLFFSDKEHNIIQLIIIFNIANL